MGVMAARNGAALKPLLENLEGTATLYRTCVAGPSGQRHDKPVGLVTYAYERTGWELEVCDPSSSEVVGYLTRSSDSKHWNEWTVQSHSEEFSDYEFNHLLGWASSPALGADILVNGVHAATANHDHARVSAGRWTAYVPKD
jgi:hypothetical protein